MRGPLDQGKVKPSRRSKGIQAKNRCREREPIADKEKIRFLLMVETNLSK
jgi:hypothetical protein